MLGSTLRSLSARFACIACSTLVLAGCSDSESGAEAETGALPGAGGASDDSSSEGAPPDLADPVLTGVSITPPGASFEGQISVELSATDAGAELRYTTDGSVPSASSPLYAGSPLVLNETTQLRVRAFVSGEARGAGAGAVFVARTFDATSDLPLVIVDGYGGGKPDQKMNGSWVTQQAAFMIFEPVSGTATLSQPPTLASRAGYHVRGQSSASFEQAPYKVELWDELDQDRKLSVIGMPPQSDWALVGPYYDRALIRHAFIYDLGREIGLSAPRFAFAEVYINNDGGPLEPGDYEGIYMVVETIKNAKGRLDLAQLEETDTTEPDISGGYIFKFDWAAASEPTLPCEGAPAVMHSFGQCPAEGADAFPPNATRCDGEAGGGSFGGFGGGGGGGGGGGFGGFGGATEGQEATCWSDLEVVDPSPLSAVQQTWLTNHVTAFNDALHQSPIGPYADFIDVPSFVDTFLINEFSKNGDAYVRSVYFHKDRGQKIVAGPLWDFNLIMALGGATFCNQNPTGWAYEFRSGSNDWFQRLIADPTFAAQVAARWRELRQGPFSQSALEQRVAALSGPLANAVVRDFERWPLCSLTGQIFSVPEGDTWEAQLQVMRDFMLERGAWMDSQLQ